jgi:hypothetical protein
MIFANKSDVKKHFSPKHPMFSYRLFVDEPLDKAKEQARGQEEFNGPSPPDKVEKPQDLPLKS